MRLFIACLTLTLCSLSFAQTTTVPIDGTVEVPVYDDTELRESIAALAARVKALEDDPPPEPEPEPEPEPGDKVLLCGHMLRPVGGFIYRGGKDISGDVGARWADGAFDINPVTGKWVVSHTRVVVQCSEPGTMGRMDQPISEWPDLTIEKHYKVLGDDPANGTGQNRILADGVKWIDDTTVIGSGRRGYRGPTDPTWVATMNFDTGIETRYTLATEQESITHFGFDQQLIFGAGFTRAPQAWADRFNAGNRILMAAGGYDVLGCAFGPTMASWSLGDDYVRPLLNHFPQEHAAQRDPAYTYPNPEHGQIPIWRSPEGGVGYWQGSPASHGAAWIDHPKVKGVVWVGLHGRGYIDYRSQGTDSQGLGPFTIEDPATFYTQVDGDGRLDRGKEFWNADGPKGFGVRTLHSFDPVQIGEVASGDRDPNDVDSAFSDLNMDGWPATDEGKNATEVSGLSWDDRRQLLWFSVRHAVGAGYVLLACEIDPTLPEPESLRVPDGWHINPQTKAFERITPIGTMHNGLSATDDGDGVSLEWEPSTLADHANYQVWYSTKPDSDWQVIGNTMDTDWFAPNTAHNGEKWFLVADRVQVGDQLKVHAIRGKVRVE